MSATNTSESGPAVGSEVSPSSPLEAPAPAFAAPAVGQDLPPSSTRTSFTRVDHEEEQRQRTQPSSSLAHDPLTQPAVPTQPDPMSEDTLGDDKAPPLTSPPSQDQQDLKVDSDSPALPELTMDEQPVPQTPQTYLTFLLISGKRRTMSFEPETAVGRVKELVWNSWPADWQDDRPPAPSYLRVLYLGRMLQDDESLANLKLPTYTPQQPSSSSSPSAAAPIPTIMHLSIRPYAPPNDGDGLKKKKRRGQDGLF
uniref:Ubiquitin-like domain-containing protein n=1 Tax=Psilocybe cubensis TaxID=181762 RepID=A0A8H7XLS1_PSICU